MQPNPKLQVVIDTNVWISGLVFGGNPEKVMRQFIEGQLIVITAEELLSELRRKIVQRFPLYEPQLALLEASIREDAILVRLGTVQISASRDADDNKFLETAVIGNAEYIISGDKDLLTIKSYDGIKILKPSDFLSLSK
jgi:uncharacterized protein